MEFVNVRDFKINATKLIRRNKAVMVFQNGKPAGVFVPWEDITVEDKMRRAAIKALADKMAKDRDEKGITEKEVLEDFASFRKNRRRRQCNPVGADRRESE